MSICYKEQEVLGSGFKVQRFRIGRSMIDLNYESITLERSIEIKTKKWFLDIQKKN